MSKIKLIYHGVIYSKKNSKRIIRNRRTGKMSLISSEAASLNERDMVHQFQGQYLAEITGRVKIDIQIYEPNYTRRDLDNQATAILDALRLAGAIEDDDFKHVAALSVQFVGIDKKDPRAEISIEEI